MRNNRTWNLRLNLDAFNAATAALADATERLAFLAGLMQGVNGAQLRPSAPPAMTEGFAFGLSMRQEAEAHRARMSAKGRAGGLTTNKKRQEKAPPPPPLFGANP